MNKKEIEIAPDELKWEMIKDSMDPDGSLRDIIIPDTNKKDWVTLFDYLKSHHANSFKVDGESPPSQIGLNEINTIQAFLSQITVRIGNVDIWGVLNPEEMEFSFEPNDVQSLKELLPIITFMIEIGRLLQRRIILAWENVSRKNPNQEMIFCFNPKVSNSKLILRSYKSAV